jgi:hypothetical protein
MAGVAKGAGEWKIFKFITFSPAAAWAMIRKRIWWLYVQSATKKFIGNGIRLQARGILWRGSILSIRKSSHALPARP